MYSEFTDLLRTDSSLRGLRCSALHFEAEVVSHQLAGRKTSRPVGWLRLRLWPASVLTSRWDTSASQRRSC